MISLVDCHARLNEVKITKFTIKKFKKNARNIYVTSNSSLKTLFQQRKKKKLQIRRKRQNCTQRLIYVSCEIFINKRLVNFIFRQ